MLLRDDVIQGITHLLILLVDKNVILMFKLVFYFCHFKVDSDCRITLYSILVLSQIFTTQVLWPKDLMVSILSQYPLNKKCPNISKIKYIFNFVHFVFSLFCPMKHTQKLLQSQVIIYIFKFTYIFIYYHIYIH